MKNPKLMLTEAVDGKIDLLRKMQAERRGVLGHDLAYRSRITQIEEGLAFRAPVYCWDPEIIETVIGSMGSLPLDTKMDRSLLYTTEGWWWFGRDNKQLQGHYSTPEILAPKKQTLCGLAYHWGEDGCVLFAYSYDHYEPTFGPVPVWTWLWDTGQTLSDAVKSYTRIVDREMLKADPEPLPADARDKFETILLERTEALRVTATTITKFFAAANVWLRSKVLEQTTMAPPRVATKRALRAKVTVPSLQYVHLRRTAHARKAEGEGKPIDWSCRWWVDGFFRNQWYPSEQKHKLIWIDEFIKGPDDKPLKPRGEKVFVVDR